MQSEHLQQIMGYYIEDANNHLAIIEQHLLNLQSTIKDPERVNELVGAARCGIVGGANLLPISSLHINSIHKTGFCLVDCFKVFQQEGSLKVDQKLEDLLMQVFYILKGLIEQLREPSGWSEDRAKQVMSEIEAIREDLMAHLNGLVTRSALPFGFSNGVRSSAELSSATLSRSHNGNHSEIAIASLTSQREAALQELAQLIPDSADDFPCIEDLESLIDELSLDSSSTVISDQ